MKKKIIALALAAILVVLTLGLASCTGKDEPGAAGESGTGDAEKKDPDRGLRRHLPAHGLYRRQGEPGRF